MKEVICENEGDFEEWINKLRQNDTMDNMSLCLNSILFNYSLKNTIEIIQKKNIPKVLSNEQKNIKDFEKRLSEAIKINSTLKNLNSNCFAFQKITTFPFKSSFLI